MLIFVFLNEPLDIVAVDEHLSAHLDEGQLAVPDLSPPEPLGCPDLGHKLLDRENSFFLGHNLGTLVFNSLFFYPIL